MKKCPEKRSSVPKSEVMSGQGFTGMFLCMFVCVYSGVLNPEKRSGHSLPSPLFEHSFLTLSLPRCHLKTIIIEENFKS